jgi:hypothetical protein
MASSGSGEAEANYWPGYVDALTAMTKVLTFIMMILGIVIFAMSQNISRAMIESVAAAAQVEVPASGNLDELRSKLVEAIAASRARPESPVPALPPPSVAADPPRPAENVQVASPPVEDRRIESASVLAGRGAPLATSVSRAGAVITLSFNRRGVELDPSASAALTEAIETGGFAQRANRIEVTASAKVDGLAVSQARRLAFYRAMLVRDQLVKAGIAASRVIVRVEDVRGGGSDLVRVFMR